MKELTSSELSSCLSLCLSLGKTEGSFRQRNSLRDQHIEAVSPSRTSAKTWNHKRKSLRRHRDQTPHRTVNITAHFSAWVSSETTSGSFLFSIYKHNNTISTETNYIHYTRRAESAALPTSPSMPQRHINGGHESPKRRSHIRIKSRSRWNSTQTAVLYSARSID